MPKNCRRTLSALSPRDTPLVLRVRSVAAGTTGYSHRLRNEREPGNQVA